MILDGNVFSWGRNDYGQLGRSSKSQNKVSKEEGLQCIEHIPKIIQLSVGSEHNIVLTGKLLYAINMCKCICYKIKKCIK